MKMFKVYIVILRFFVKRPPDLHSAESVEEMGVMVDRRSQSAACVLTLLYEREDLVPLHAMQTLHQIHDGQAPVNAAHAQILRDDVLLE